MYDSCIDDGYDAEPVYYLHTVFLRKARKKHRCGECGETIHPGEQYEYAKRTLRCPLV